MRGSEKSGDKNRLKVTYQRTVGELDRRKIDYFKARRDRPLPSATQGIEVFYGKKK